MTVTAGVKVSARDQALSDWITDRLYYKRMVQVRGSSASRKGRRLSCSKTVPFFSKAPPWLYYKRMVQVSFLKNKKACLSSRRCCLSTLVHTPGAVLRMVQVPGPLAASGSFSPAPALVPYPTLATALLLPLLLTTTSPFAAFLPRETHE